HQPLGHQSLGSRDASEIPRRMRQRGTTGADKDSGHYVRSRSSHLRMRGLVRGQRRLEGQPDQIQKETSDNSTSSHSIGKGSVRSIQNHAEHSDTKGGGDTANRSNAGI